MARELYMGDRLEGPQLDAANAVLRSRGLAPMPGPCTVLEMMNSICPMETGRWVSILDAVTQAVEACLVDEGMDEAQGAERTP